MQTELHGAGYLSLAPLPAERSLYIAGRLRI
jgi:hypothetical protein